MSVRILGPLAAAGQKIPVYGFHFPAGFPSPAADHIDKQISLDELFDIRAPHVYLAMIEGDSMQGAGIFCGDMVMVNRSIEAKHGDIVIASINAEPVCKRLYKTPNAVALMSENANFPSRHVMEGDELSIWGVVKYSIRDHDNT